jgi:hypothetical protein
MWGVAIVATVAASAYLIVLRLVTRDLKHSTLPWHLLAWSGIPLALSGLAFAVRFWRPSSGPYVANRLYPFGGHLQAWAVSFGFTWLAFGLLFTGAVVYVSRRQGWRTWTLLVTSWSLCWLPHAVIGIGFTFHGAHRQSVRIYGEWWNDPAGAIILASGSFLLLWHFVFSIAGFAGTAVEIRRRARTKSDER